MGVFMKRATQTRLPIKVQPEIIARRVLRKFTPCALFLIAWLKDVALMWR